jgi:hypothetical protein
MITYPNKTINNVAACGVHHLFYYCVPEEGNDKFLPCVRTFYLFNTAKYSENFST